jgi:hypothetical protein
VRANANNSVYQMPYIKRTIPKRSFPKFSSHKNNGDNGE